MGHARQPHFPAFSSLSKKDFGGSLLRGNPREARPISTKRPMHLVLRSTLAVGERSFLKRGRQIEALVRRAGKQQGVRVYRFANSGNHLHLIVLPRSRKAYHAFVRAISGLIARLVLGAERGAGRVQPSESGKSSDEGGGKSNSKSNSESSAKSQPQDNGPHLKFWDSRPFTRIIEWGRDFRAACAYVRQNWLEALGFLTYRPRKDRRRSQRPRKQAEQARLPQSM